MTFAHAPVLLNVAGRLGVDWSDINISGDDCFVRSHSNAPSWEPSIEKCDYFGNYVQVSTAFRSNGWLHVWSLLS